MSGYDKVYHVESCVTAGTYHVEDREEGLQV